ncbi:MAG TPA: YbhN family protein [Acidimicrobiales bacterium]|nr:YbhN family protein [Acidimicrobiales bacterium]
MTAASLSRTPDLERPAGGSVGAVRVLRAVLSPSDPRLKLALRIARYLIGLGLAGLAVVVLLGRKGELSGSAASFRHLRLWWLAPSLLVEAISMVCFARTLGRLLTEGRHRLRPGPVLAITLASNAIANSLPAGPAFGAAYAYRRMRDLGVPEIVAGWAMLASGVLAAAALALMASVGVAVALDQSTDLNLVSVTAGTVAVSVVLLGLLRRPGLLAGPVVLAARASRRLFGIPRSGPGPLAEMVRSRLAVVTPSWPGLSAAFGWAFGNWTFDLSCLIFAFLAVDSAVPWRGILLAYGAAQLASNLPITPGGLGVVEGSLTIGLVAYGGAEASTVAAVLVYRVLSFWLPLLIGWAVAGVLALKARRAVVREAGPDVRVMEVSG